jgi:hypothetical protein
VATQRESDSRAEGARKPLILIDHGGKGQTARASPASGLPRNWGGKQLIRR